MATSTLSVSLPEQVVRRLEEAARASRQSVEDVAARSIEGNLPPSVTSAPAVLRDELLALQALSDVDLLAIAESQADPAQQARHLILLEKVDEEDLTAAEQLELADARENADRLMVRKAHAWSVLRWRGCNVPDLEDVPLDAS